MLEAVLYAVDGIDDRRYLIEEQSHSGSVSCRHTSQESQGI